MNDNFNNFDPLRIYRDTRNKQVAGVASGIASHFGFSVGATRLLMFVAIFMSFPIGLFVYIGAAVLLKPMPSKTFETPEEEVFWRGVRRSPKATFSSVRFRLRQIDHNLQRMERYVTSPRFKLDRDFQSLERDDDRNPSSV